MPAQPEADEPVAEIQPQRAAPSRPPPKADRSPPIPPRFETFTVSDGLVSNEANVFLQDRQGFLWVAAYDGLSRYDGASFTEFHHDPADPHSLGDDITSRLFESRDGHLWVGLESGLDRYDPVTETFTHYRHDPADTPRPEGSVQAIINPVAVR